MTDQDYVRIFDTTLRDGEQCPGAAMNENEKIEIARHLAKMNVDVIEAGFPVSSPVQFKAVERIAREIEGPIITGLARSLRVDIESAANALKPAKRKRIHTFLATSPIHMKHKLGKTPSEVLKLAIEAVKMARDFVDDVEFSPEDGTRSDWEFLREICEGVIEAGATTINVPDTVGYTTPEKYGELFNFLIKNVRGADKIVFSAHCHNDLGLATANSLSAIVNGVRQVECTINGIGERAGNTAMEEVVMALRTRKDFYGITTRIDTTQIFKASYLVKNITGMTVQPNKAVVGANAFAHESGIHQDGVIKNRETYEIMTPQSIGLESNRMVLGRHSGRAGFKDRIIRLGFQPKQDELELAYTKFLEIADKKKEIFDEDIISLFTDQHRKTGISRFILEYFHISTGSKTVPTATIKLRVNDVIIEESATGDGPVDAVFKAIEKATKMEPELSRLVISPVTEGKDALAEASVTLNLNGKRVVGKGGSTDIIEASALSFIDALNRL
ncbi:MAG: 2-isopropylmalate synthase [Leptospiraceae bacterium]|nr:2-isopropylmalate synthase [Leptospiraceae bacterium]MBK7054936.1 2-isopropylmalate synthase [Leptospiraceae bacterium]MBK9501365.1 2-isopropylmalate synthase [Leptospiraceae bacterium]MBL0266903.1 2-isopropylmalate synthase [Leptospiraceae bacterium]MBP9163172.1 2-isopropylmalate synthase [Leptospiraceae bacterium]